MKKWLCGAGIALIVALLFCLPVGAEQAGAQYSTLPEQYTALEELIPAQVAAVFAWAAALLFGAFACSAGALWLAVGREWRTACFDLWAFTAMRTYACAG